MLHLLINTASAASLPVFDSAQGLGGFISNLYSYSITIVGILIFVRFLYAGFLYLTAAASPANISKARSMMANAIIGAVLLFSAYLILYIINPDLVKNSFSFGGLLNPSGSQPPRGTPSKIDNFDVNPKQASLSANPDVSFTLKLSGSQQSINEGCNAYATASILIFYSVKVTVDGKPIIIRNISGYSSDFSGGGQFSKDFSQKLTASEFNEFIPKANNTYTYTARIMCSASVNYKILNESSGIQVQVLE